jgi:transcriptional regulator with XRE-family HTH domain
MSGENDDIGARIKNLRKRRGFRTPKELANAIAGGKVTEAILQNIESGRKPDLTLSQFFNIALALRVAPSYLLVSLAHPNAQVNLPNASNELKEMTNLEFDSWISAIEGGPYTPSRSDEHAERTQLQLLRELHRETVENRRLLAIYAIAKQPTRPPEIELDGSLIDDYESRIHESLARIRRLSTYLQSAGWSASALGVNE